MKTIWNFLKSRFFWLNILGAFLLVVILAFVLMFVLRSYTRHGESYEVPDLLNMYVSEAELVLENSGISFEVVDSVYLRSLEPGEISEQSPAAGTRVKRNRKVYLTINAMHQRLVNVPYLVGDSRRKVQSNLRTLGFKVDSVRYKPYEFDDEVLEVICGDKIVEEGAKLPDGSSLIIVVGQSDNTLEITVPDLEGLRYDDAVAKIEHDMLSVGSTYFDVKPISDQDKRLYYIYHQTPAAGAVVGGGKRIDLWFSKDRKKTMSKSDASNDEEFF